MNRNLGRTKAVLLLDESGLLQEISDSLPMPLIEVLGRSILQRTVDSLRDAGVEDIQVVAGFEKPLPAYAQENLDRLEGATVVGAPVSGVWHKAEQLFMSLTDAQTSALLLVRLNVYAEVDWNAFVQQHLDRNSRVTRVWATAGDSAETLPLDIFAIAPNRRNDAAYLLRNGMKQSRNNLERYDAGEGEYVRTLRSAADLRELAADGLYRRSNLAPFGREVRPGVFVGEGTRIDRGARLVAPVYIGRRCRIRARALVTRAAAIEQHSIIDCGCIVDAATVLPYSEVGPALDVSRCVVGNKRLFSLSRQVTTELLDPKLFREVTYNAGLRTLAQAANLAAFLPSQLFRGLRRAADAGNVTVIDRDEVCEPAHSATLHSTKPELELQNLAPSMAVMRRYGNQ